MSSRIVLGTAQFGMNYGIANTRGQVPAEEARKILSSAWTHGIRMLDTAVLYGASESTLGSLDIAGWKVISKLPPCGDSAATPRDWLGSQLSASLARLRVDGLHALLLHRPAELLGPRGDLLYQSLVAERESGRVGKIGISVYGPEELEALPRWMRFDIVQAPWNVLDQRMTRSGWAARLQGEGCEFHARSVFLQGLLLMPARNRHPYFARWKNAFDAWDAWLEENQLSPLQGCLQQALGVTEISRIVLGVDSAAHLGEVLAPATAGPSTSPLPASMASSDAELLNPAQWRIA